jgi:hypothetical protein
MLAAKLEELGSETEVSPEAVEELNAVLCNSQGHTTILEFQMLEQIVTRCNELDFPLTFDEIASPVRAILNVP